MFSEQCINIRHVLPSIGYLPHMNAADPISGIAGAARSLARQQARQGAVVELLGWNPASPHQYVDAYGVHTWTLPFVPMPWRGQYNLRWLLASSGWCIRRAKADVVHVHTESALGYAARGSIKVFHIQTPVKLYATPERARWLKQYEAIICCSEYTRQQFLHNFAYPSERTFTIHNGVNWEMFTHPCSQNVRTQLGLDPDALVIMYAGAFVPEKGLQHLISAVRMLHADYPHVHLVVAGGSSVWLEPDTSAHAMSPFERQLRQSAHGLPIHFLGPVAADIMPGVYADADLFVCPSVWQEPLGMVVVEAMAAGKPVIGSAVGGIVETIRDGSTGLLVPPADEATLANAMRTLLDQHDLRRTMGHAARERAKLFTWQAAARRVIDIYQQFLNS